MADISMSYTTVSQLEEKAAFLETGFNDFIRDFDSITEDIMDGWDGKGKTDLAAKCDAVLPVMTSISELLDKYSSAIHQAVYLLQSADSAEAENLGNLTIK